MPYSYKGSISFGLVYIPIKLEACIQNNSISFNQLDKNTMSRVRYKKTCDGCADKEIKQTDIIKGYEYEDGKYVIFDESDFEKIKTKKDKNIVIERFVDLNEIDPIYYDKAYYVVPNGADKAFALLKESMKATNKAGIAKSVLGTKESLIALHISGDEMRLNTMFFNDDIKKNPAKEIDEKLSNEEKELAQMIIKSMSAKFEPRLYKDEYTQRVKSAIEAKIAGQEIATPKIETEGRIADLMQALQASLENVNHNFVQQ